MNELEVATAASVTTAAVPTAAPTESVGEMLHNVQVFSNQFDTIDYIYILTDAKLVGVVSLHELFSEKPETLASACMTTKVAYVHTHSHKENVAQVALAQNIKAVPVVDTEEVFVGVVTADVILQILRDEHTEDILKYAGVNVSAQDTISNYTLWQHYRSRTPWLVLGLFGGVLAAWVVESFSETIAAEVVLAAFIPAIVYIADAVGSQTQMVFVRTLSSRHQQSLATVLRREVLVATTVGITLASIIGALSYMWLSTATVPIILAISVLLTVYFSVLVAILLPWLFSKLGYDPAIATGPLATVIRDVSSLCIYFLIAFSLL